MGGDLAMDDVNSAAVAKKDLKQKQKKGKAAKKAAKKDSKKDSKRDKKAKSSSSSSSSKSSSKSSSSSKKRKAVESSDSSSEAEGAVEDSRQSDSSDDGADSAVRKRARTDKSSDSSSTSNGSASAKAARAAAAVSSGLPEGAPEGSAPFSDFGDMISAEAISLLKEKHVTCLFPIQAASFRQVFQGHDVIGRARTGTGKTLSFALPIVEKLRSEAMADKSAAPKNRGHGRAPLVLCLAPTRELAKQVAQDFKLVGRNLLSTTEVYGGVEYDGQNRDFRNGVDVVVGTPGRMIDHIQRGNLRLDALRWVVLDEADEMLDIGFADDIETILKSVKEADSPHQLQVLLFSATVPSWVKGVAQKYMRPDHLMIDMIGDSKMRAAETVSHFAIQAHWTVRAKILGDVVRAYGNAGPATDGKKETGSNKHVARTIVFADTKAMATELATQSSLSELGAQALHGDIAQKQREITMQGFRDGAFKCLIATDVAARGLDVPDVDLVINCEPPSNSETYIHRSGRTGRAGRSGRCITFCTVRQALDGMLTKIERQVGIKFKRMGNPQPKDMVMGEVASLEETILLGVHPEMTELFLPAAQRLLEGADDPAEVLAQALAAGANMTQPLQTRSLLQAEEGFTTVRYTNERPGFQIRTPFFVVNLLKSFGASDVKEVVLCSNNTAAVADVISADAKKLVVNNKLQRESDPKCTEIIEICDEIPDDVEIKSVGGGGGGGGGGRGGGFGGRGGFGRGGYGGGGRGGGRGGYGGGRGGGGGYGGGGNGFGGRGGGGGFRGGRGFGRGGRGGGGY